MRNREATHVANERSLQIARAIVKRTLFLDAREKRDQEIALNALDRLLESTRRKLYDEPRRR